MTSGASDCIVAVAVAVAAGAVAELSRCAGHQGLNAHKNRTGLGRIDWTLDGTLTRARPLRAQKISLADDS